MLLHSILGLEVFAELSVLVMSLQNILEDYSQNVLTSTLHLISCSIFDFGYSYRIYSLGREVLLHVMIGSPSPFLSHVVD